MSDTPAELIIRVGSDPRERPEFEAIRQEINKISHPSQPEVNWSLIESLALTLFRTHGVDLQTAVYYTLARSHKQGLPGFTEGCELLAAMIVHQWDSMWPQQPQARADILEWFNARAGSVLRQHLFTRNDLQLLYRTERALQLMCDKLQQVEFKRVPRIENLLYLMQNSVKRLEAPTSTMNIPPAMPPKIIMRVYLAEPETTQPKKAGDVLQPDVGVQVMPSAATSRTRFSALWGFTAGVLFSLLLAAVAYFAWIIPQQQTLAALSAGSEGAARYWLMQPDLATYGEQLRRLDTLSPLAGHQLADALVATARTRWPASEKQQAESQRREQLLQSRVTASQEENSYFRVQKQLQALSDELLQQEKSRSGLTISYLKTAVYQMQSELNRDVSLEELIRRYGQAVQHHQPISTVLAEQTEERLKTLLSRYHQLITQAGESR